MFAIMLVAHVLICICLVVVTLLQRGKGGGLSGVFGGGGSQSVFGGRGATPVLAKATIVFATLFMLSSLSLTLISVSRRAPRSAVEQEIQKGHFAPVEEGLAPLMPIEEQPESTGE